jgi:hypothetical protein
MQDCEHIVDPTSLKNVWMSYMIQVQSYDLTTIHNKKKLKIQTI